MDAREYENWKVGSGLRVPCYDCTAEYAAEMRAENRCRLLIGDGSIIGRPGHSPLDDPETKAQYNRLKAAVYRRRQGAVDMKQRTAHRIALAVALRDAGASTPDIAMRVGHSERVVKEWLRRARDAA